MNRPLFLALFFVLMAGCSATPPTEVQSSASAMGDSEAGQRALIRQAWVEVEVEDADRAAQALTTLVNASSGQVVYSRTDDSRRSRFQLRIPPENLDAFLDGLSTLGDVQSSRVEVQDVTDQMTDLEATITNLIRLRDRYRQLLGRADKIEEILRIEQELARLQTRLDKAERAQRVLSAQVALSPVSVTLEEQTIYGPLGYVGVGLGWVLSKLFVIN